MKKLFTDHPESVGETYGQHFQYAFLFGANMVIGGVACILHSIFPFIFERTGSDILLKEMEKWINRMPKLDERVQRLGKLIEEKQSASIRERT